MKNKSFKNISNTMAKRHTNCVVFITHKIDDIMTLYLSYLKQEITNCMDFFILYDCHSQDINTKNFPDFQFYMFDSCKLESFFHYESTRLPNPLVALIDFAKKNEYEHYLLMENDIVFTGNMNTFIQTIDSVHCDYMHIATDVLGGPQNHWPIKFIKDNPFSHIYFSWCQLFYVSHQYLADLEIFMKENNSFYYEFLLPTMAYNRGYSIRQFENFGYRFQLSWGPVEVFEYKYLYERMHNTFYHPIKNLNIVKI